MILLELSRVVIAEGLGYLSIACWLCAQFPQVVKNIQLQSCEGLALPFLCNWLFGDVTNLIGCVLTNQLPFQTYLAAYFCVVDFTLVFQYFYYRKPISATPSTPRTPFYYTSPHQSLVLPPPQLSRSRSTTHHPLVSSHPSANSVKGVGSRWRGNQSTTSTHFPPDIAVTSPPDSFEAMYVAALDVARAAERVTRHRSHSGRRRSFQQTIQGGENEEIEAGMITSFHSEASVQSASTDADEDDPEVLRRMSQSTGALLDGRGRTRQRGMETGTLGDFDVVEGLPSEGGRGIGRDPRSRSKSRSQSQARTRGAGRRAAGVAFLSIGMLLSRGRVWSPSGSRGGESVPGVGLEPVGTVIGSTSAISSSSSSVSFTSPFSVPFPSLHPKPLPLHTTYTAVAFDEDNNGDDLERESEHPREPDMSLQHVIGRLSAWACTTLYLTSRLPQIWKNDLICLQFQRRSIEGLSTLLFVFAFCGNLTYVISILLSPSGDGDPGGTAHYLLEALPYLLGSGGTLVFDLTIMIQAAIYGSAPPVPSTPHDRPRKRVISRRGYARHHVEDGLANTGTGIGVGVLVDERQSLLHSHQPYGSVREPSSTRTGSGSGRSRSRPSTHNHNHSHSHSHSNSTSQLGAGLGVRLFGDSPTKAVPSG